MNAEINQNNNNNNNIKIRYFSEPVTTGTFEKQALGSSPKEEFCVVIFHKTFSLMFTVLFNTHEFKWVSTKCCENPRETTTDKSAFHST